MVLYRTGVQKEMAQLLFGSSLVAYSYLVFLNLKSLLGKWLLSFCTAVLPVGSPVFSFFILFAKAIAVASLVLSLSSASAGESQGATMVKFMVCLEEERRGVERESVE